MLADLGDELGAEALAADVDNVGDLVSGQVVCIHSKGSGVLLSVCTQGDLFQQASRASGISDSAGCVGGVVREPRQMIQLVFGFPCLFPNSDADISILRGP